MSRNPLEIDTFKRSLADAKRSKSSLRFSGTLEDLEEIFDGVDLDTTLPKKIGVETTVKAKGRKNKKSTYLYRPSDNIVDLNIQIDHTIETLDATYEIGPEVLSTIRHHKSSTHAEMARMLTSLRAYEHFEGPYELMAPLATNEITRLTEPRFDERHVRALFWLPGRNEYSYLRVRIAKSTVPKAGMGVYAIDPIPSGARALYKGVARREKDANMYYAWMIRPYDHNTGVPDWDSDQVLYYVDATDPETSNWTRYVNCGPTQKSNNFDCDQLFDKMFYVATRDILPDEEIFIDYGEGYRDTNLRLRY